MPEAESQSLKSELAESRELLARHGAVLAERLNVASRVRQHFQRHLVAWLATAATLGLLMTVRRRRRSEVRTVLKAVPSPEARAGFFGKAAKVALEFAGPALVAWARRRFTKATPPK